MSKKLATTDGYTEDQFREDLRTVHESHQNPAIARAAGKAVDRFDEMIEMARTEGEGDENDDKPVEMDPTTLKEVARIMREAIGQEIPVGPAQTGSFNATLTWAAWLDQQAEQKKAAR